MDIQIQWIWIRLFKNPLDIHHPMDIQWILGWGYFFRVSFKIPLKTRLSTEVRGQKVLQVAYSGHSNGVTGLSGCSIDSLASFRALGLFLAP